MRLKRQAHAASLSIALALLMSCAPTRGRRTSASVPTDSNDPCYMCHMLFTDEEISVAHLKAGFPCSHCHGKSLAHMADETFSTAPDVVYSKDEVNSFCRTCHPLHPNVPPENLVQVWLARNSELFETGYAEKEVVCTDCHGSHRIARRPGTAPGLNSGERAYRAGSMSSFPLSVTSSIPDSTFR